MIVELTHLFIRDYVDHWYKPLTESDEEFGRKVSHIVLGGIDELQRRFEKMDILMFLLFDVVRIMSFHLQSTVRHSLSHFPSHPCLASPEAEVQYLHRITDVLIKFLLPSSETALPAVRTLLREIIAKTCLQDSMNYFCDPDYLNQYIVYRCDQIEVAEKKTDKSYRYAPTFERFMLIIRTCNNIEQLKEIRYHVIAEIVQAAHIEKCKRMVARGGPAARAALSMLADNEKSAMLSDRNLVRYTNQCALAKNECERRIALLGGFNYRTMNMAMQQRRGGSDALERTDLVRGTALFESEKVLRLSEILNDGLALSYFCQYLQKFHDDINLKFWLTCQGLRSV
jgi:sorting nexin-25